jgi:hypothetical protein
VLDPKLRESGPPKTNWTYHGNSVWRPEPIGPQLFPRGHTITAKLNIPKGGAEGVVTCGSKEGGMINLFVDDMPAGEGKLTRSAFRHGLEPFEGG